MKLYYYEGPVLEFNRIISNSWKGSTRAETEAKARSNLAYQFKKQYGRAANSRITVPGKIFLRGDDDDG